MADDERAARIREVKKDHPALTWRAIADACGVSERSAHHWQKDGKISYAHARLFASYCEVDLDWLWRGPREDDGQVSQLDRIEAMLKDLGETQSELAAEFQRQIAAFGRASSPRSRGTTRKRSGSQP